MPAPARIDWESAEAAYLAQTPPRSFVGVARAFSVTPNAVKYQAGKRDWLQKAADIDRATQEKARDYVIRSRAARIADTYAVIDQTRERYLEQLKRDLVEIRPSDIAALVKIEQLLDGEATERIDISAVRHVFALFISGARPLVDDERWPAFVAMLERTAETLALNPPTDALGSGS
jgi:hypothetical protein